MELAIEVYLGLTVLFTLCFYVLPHGMIFVMNTFEFSEKAAGKIVSYCRFAHETMFRTGEPLRLGSE